MRGVTIVVAEPARLRVALELAAATAALGGRARVFAHGAAVAALRLGDDDPRHATTGQPAMATLFAEATTLGVATIACQGGLALTGIDMATLDPRIEAGGLVGLLQTIGQDRLLTV